jgi:hypothetical protein
MGLFGPKLTPGQTDTLNGLKTAIADLDERARKYARENHSQFRRTEGRFSDPEKYGDSEVEDERVRLRAYKEFLMELANRLHAYNNEFIVANELDTSDRDTFSWPKWAPMKLFKKQQKMMHEWSTLVKMIDEGIGHLDGTSYWIRFTDKLKG